MAPPGYRNPGESQCVCSRGVLSGTPSTLLFPPAPSGEYMLREVSDTEDSFSADEEEEAIGGRGGGGDEGVKDTPPFIPLPPTSPSITEEGSGGVEGEGAAKKEGGGENTATEAAEEDKGDPEMAPVYLKRLLPIFTELFHSSLAPALRSVRPLPPTPSGKPGYRDVAVSVVSGPAGRSPFACSAKCVATSVQSGWGSCVRWRLESSGPSSPHRSVRCWLWCWRMRSVPFSQRVGERDLAHRGSGVPCVQ